MQVLTHPRQALALNSAPLVVVLGNFDGVHLGHQALLAQAQAYGEVLVLTLDPHPMVFLKKASRFLISSAELKAQWLAASTKYLCTLDFTKIYQQSPAAFMAEYLADFPAHTAIMVGANFNFGYQQAGTPQTIQEAYPQFKVHVFPLQTFQDDHGNKLPISSRQIRALLQKGDLQKAAQLLGRPFTLDGTIKRGQGLAHQLNFATANLPISPTQILPPFGVYLSTLIHQETRYPAISYLGVRPSVAVHHIPLLETHLLTTNLDLYEKKVAVELSTLLRPEQKFNTITALQEQVALDMALAKKLHHLD